MAAKSGALLIGSFNTGGVACVSAPRSSQHNEPVNDLWSLLAIALEEAGWLWLVVLAHFLRHILLRLALKISLFLLMEEKNMSVDSITLSRFTLTVLISFLAGIKFVNEFVIGKINASRLIY